MQSSQAQAQGHQCSRLLEPTPLLLTALMQQGGKQTALDSRPQQGGKQTALDSKPQTQTPGHTASARERTSVYTSSAACVSGSMVARQDRQMWRPSP